MIVFDVPSTKLVTASAGRGCATAPIRIAMMPICVERGSKPSGASKAPIASGSSGPGSASAPRSKTRMPSSDENAAQTEPSGVAA
jgi:hypothetical protein